MTAAALEPADLVGLASGDGLGAATELLEELPWPDGTYVRADLIEVTDSRAGAIDTDNP